MKKGSMGKMKMISKKKIYHCQKISRKNSLIFTLLIPSISLFIPLSPSFLSLSHASTNNSFHETFDARESSATINGVDLWGVTDGSASNAITLAGDTFSGSGKALELVGSATPVKLIRADSYGNVTPASIEWVIKPGLGNQSSPVPAGGIAAFSFDRSGKILASDGHAWVDTGLTFSEDSWYRVLMRLDFTNHNYDIYISPGASSKIPFVPDKENLGFIDPTINSLSEIGFDSAYNETKEDNTFMDEVTVSFVKRLEIISAVQNIVKNKPSGPITIQLQNANSEPQTAWEDITLELGTSSDEGTFSLDRETWSPVTEATISSGAQQITLYYKDGKEGKPIISLSEYPQRGWEEATQQFSVVAEGQAFEVSALSPQVAGQAFTVRVTAQDDAGNADTTYHGAVEIEARYVSPSSGTKLLSPIEATGFSEGKKDITLIYPDSGTIEIVVLDKENSSKKGKSGHILFVPEEFSIVAEASQITGKPFALTVTALNADGQATPNYQGPLLLEPLAIQPDTVLGALLTPAELSNEHFANGTAQVDVSYNRWGSIHIKASDQASPERVGESEAIEFSPAAVLMKAKNPPITRNFFYTGESFDITLSIVDADGVPIPNFVGLVRLDSTPKLDLPSEYNFLEEDHGQKIFTLSAKSSGNFVAKVESVEYPSLTAETQPINIKQASIQVVSTVAPIGTTEVEIQLVDEHGKRITSENELTVIILWEEENANGSVFTSLDKPIVFHKGLAKIVVGDTEAETVTLSPQSDLGFGLQKGTITFGRIGKSGIGTLMMLESKDEEEKKKKKDEGGV